MTATRICPTKQKALASHPTREAAIDASKRNQNCAFLRNDQWLTCSRVYVSDCLNASQKLDVASDHDNDD